MQRQDSQNEPQNGQNSRSTPPPPPASRNDLQKYLQSMWTLLEEYGQRIMALEQKVVALLDEARTLTGEGSELQPSLRMLMNELREVSERLDRLERAMERQ